jgi:hypothetical protein
MVNTCGNTGKDHRVHTWARDAPKLRAVLISLWSTALTAATVEIVRMK